MKKYSLSLILILLHLQCLFAQNTKDTGVFYISPMVGLYTGSGSFAERLTPDIEFGRQWDVFSLGIDIGKTNWAKKSGRDTTVYIELRPSLNVFQQGKFTNTLTIGIGGIFNATENTFTEFSSGIEYTPNPKFSYNIFFGTYYFSGKSSASNNNFLGLSAMYFIYPKNKKRGLFNKN